MRFLRNITVFLSLVAILILPSCIDEKISTNPELKLEFSTDTLLFDTIFTTIGSSTSIVKVYNKNRENLNISNIALAGGSHSPFMINVDGQNSENQHFQDIELRGGDSLFLFIEVNIDPNSENLPVFVKDSITFKVNSNLQNVKLIAYGQDIEILRNRKISNDTTLNGQKPYLIFGDLVVDSAKTLTLDAGAKLYFHDQASLIVYGNLIANGNLKQPIIMRGDRTDKIFPDIPYNVVSNQWGGVLLLNPTGNHKLNYVKMNSGYVGLYFKNEDRNFTPNLTISNSIIHNFLKYGIVAENGNLTVSNSEISNTGSYTLYLSGGTHRFYHTTIANYFNSTNIKIQPSGREGDAAVMVMDLGRIAPMKTVFENSIIAGSNDNELEILTKFPQLYNAKFKNCYIKKAEKDTISKIFENITWGNRKDTIFANTYYELEKLKYYNFSLDSVSVARGKGDLNIAKKYPLDLNGSNRTTNSQPDLGAYQWQPSEKKRKN